MYKKIIFCLLSVIFCCSCNSKKEPPKATSHMYTLISTENFRERFNCHPDYFTIYLTELSEQNDVLNVRSIHNYKVGGNYRYIADPHCVKIKVQIDVRGGSGYKGVWDAQKTFFINGGNTNIDLKDVKFGRLQLQIGY